MISEQTIRDALAVLAALLLWLQAREARKQADAARQIAGATESKVDRVIASVQLIENRLQQAQSQNVSMTVNLPTYPPSTPTYPALSGTPASQVIVERAGTTSPEAPQQAEDAQRERLQGKEAR